MSRNSELRLRISHVAVSLHVAYHFCILRRPYSDYQSVARYHSSFVPSVDRHRYMVGFALFLQRRGRRCIVLLNAMLYRKQVFLVSRVE